MSSVVKRNNQGSWKYEGFKVKTIIFYEGMGFGFPASLRCGNVA